MSYDDEKITSAAEHHVEHAESTTSSELPATRDEEAKIIWKLDLRLMPFVFVLYSLSVLDRSNLGNARLAGLEQDLHLNSSKYNWLGTIFYIACAFLCLSSDGIHSNKDKTSCFSLPSPAGSSSRLTSGAPSSSSSGASSRPSRPPPRPGEAS